MPGGSDYQGPADSLEMYTSVVNSSAADLEVKGAKNPYTSRNGHISASSMPPARWPFGYQTSCAKTSRRNTASKTCRILPVIRQCTSRGTLCGRRESLARSRPARAAARWQGSQRALRLGLLLLLGRLRFKRPNPIVRTGEPRAQLFGLRKQICRDRCVAAHDASVLDDGPTLV